MFCQVFLAALVPPAPLYLIQFHFDAAAAAGVTVIGPTTVENPPDSTVIFTESDAFVMIAPWVKLPPPSKSAGRAGVSVPVVPGDSAAHDRARSTRVAIEVSGVHKEFVAPDGSVQEVLSNISCAFIEGAS